MYSIGQMYKIKLKGDIFYTGLIVNEDELQINIKTIRNEDIIISKSEISRSIMVTNEQGGVNEKNVRRI